MNRMSIEGNYSMINQVKRVQEQKNKTTMNHMLSAERNNYRLAVLNNNYEHIQYHCST